jgi:hypothetical protein
LADIPAEASLQEAVPLKVLFLDIDGVLLPTRAWILPRNQTYVATAAGRRHSVGEMARQVQFDPVAMALLNRLCTRTGACIVVHSNWRRNVGIDETRAKLLEQGLDEVHLHKDWFCTWRRSSEKCHDISEWLSDHRLTPCPEYPAFDASRSVRDAWYRASSDYGFEFLVLDDEPLGAFEDRHLQMDAGEGLVLADYRTACGFLGGVDPQMGVHSVSAEDMEHVVSIWKEKRLQAATWLHQAPGGLWSPARRLRAEPDKVGQAAALLLGYGGSDPVAEAAQRRVHIMEQLVKDTVHLRRRHRRVKLNFEF